MIILSMFELKPFVLSFQRKPLFISKTQYFVPKHEMSSQELNIVDMWISTFYKSFRDGKTWTLDLLVTPNVSWDHVCRFWLPFVQVLRVPCVKIMTWNSEYYVSSVKVQDTTFFISSLLKMECFDIKGLCKFATAEFINSKSCLSPFPTSM